MFNKKDYRQYFKEIYQIELMMKQEGEELLKLITDQDSRKLIKILIADEIKHAKIVKKMMKLI